LSHDSLTGGRCLHARLLRPCRSRVEQGMGDARKTRGARTECGPFLCPRERPSHDVQRVGWALLACREFSSALHPLPSFQDLGPPGVSIATEAPWAWPEVRADPQFQRQGDTHEAHVCITVCQSGFRPRGTRANPNAQGWQRLLHQLLSGQMRRQVLPRWLHGCLLPRQVVGTKGPGRGSARALPTAVSIRLPS